jgi:hypothetical protein
MNYEEKKAEMEKKYAKAVEAIAEVNEVDSGVAFEMLRANIIDGADNAYVNVEEFKKDYAELLELAAK